MRSEHVEWKHLQITILIVLGRNFSNVAFSLWEKVIGMHQVFSEMMDVIILALHVWSDSKSLNANKSLQCHFL